MHYAYPTACTVELSEIGLDGMRHTHHKNLSSFPSLRKVHDDQPRNHHRYYLRVGLLICSYFSNQRVGKTVFPPFYYHPFLECCQIFLQQIYSSAILLIYLNQPIASTRVIYVQSSSVNFDYFKSVCQQTRRIIILRFLITSCLLFLKMRSNFPQVELPAGYLPFPPISPPIRTNQSPSLNFRRTAAPSLSHRAHARGQSLQSSRLLLVLIRIRHHITSDTS